MAKLWRNPSSFRDPSGYVLHSQEGVFRSLDRNAYDFFLSFAASPVFGELVDQELLIPSEPVDEETHSYLSGCEGRTDRFYLQHKRLPFISYPYEWTSLMLMDAGHATLRVQSLIMQAGFNLKDASAYNIQFDVGDKGPAPIFIDIASTEHLPSLGGAWLPYRQFLAHFLLPLIYHQKFGHDFRGVFLESMDGLDPERAFRMTGGLRRLFPPFFGLVTLPHLLRGWEANRGGRTDCRTAPESEVHRQKELFILRHTVRSLGRKLGRSSRLPGRSDWSEYEDTQSYSDSASLEKERYVGDLLEELRPESVLDIGCNTGKYSLMAAGQGARVLALDSDMESLNRLYLRAKETGASVLPLRVDITNPSPAIGWNNLERPSFLERLGQSDCLLALAILHHLMVGEGIPLAEVVALLDRLAKRHLIVELVDPSDPMFQSLLRGREYLYHDLSLDVQEDAFRGCFKVVDSLAVTGMARRLCLLEKR